MSEIKHVLSTIKQRLKAAGLTYREVAQALDISEPTVKRLFSGNRLTLERLAQLSELLGFTMAELLQQAQSTTPQLQMLTLEQETRLVENEKLLLIAVCTLNHWSIADMVSAYRLTQAECIKHLLALDRMGIAELKPGNRIRLKVARDFDWLPYGPIKQFFVKNGLPDFLDSRFDLPDEMLVFSHGMLTQAAYTQMQLELRKLRARIAALHDESAAAPLSEKRGCALVLALRDWEPQAFIALKRGPRTARA